MYSRNCLLWWDKAKTGPNWWLGWHLLFVYPGLCMTLFIWCFQDLIINNTRNIKEKNSSLSGVRWIKYFKIFKYLPTVILFCRLRWEEGFISWTGEIIFAYYTDSWLVCTCVLVVMRGLYVRAISFKKFCHQIVRSLVWFVSIQKPKPSQGITRK